MSVFDGEPGDLGFEQAQLEIARAGVYPSEAHREAVVTAVEKHYGIGRQNPDTLAAVSAGRPKTQHEIELDALRQEVAALRASVPAPVDPREAELEAQRAELEQLRAQVAQQQVQQVPA